MTRTPELLDRAPPLAPRNYYLLLGAFFVSTTGDWLYRLALPLLVLQMTGSALQTAAVYTLEYLPYVLFAPLGGVLADRADRRTLLIRADLTAAAVTGALTVLVWYEVQRLWMVYLAAFLLSAITPLYHAAFQGMVPRTVPAHRLGWANSRLQATQSALDLAGPLAGAGAVAALGTAWALGVDTASFALSALVVSLIARIAGPPIERAGQTVVADLRAAMTFLRRSPPLLWGAVLGAGSTFGLTAVSANMITYLVGVRDLPVAAIGIAFAALGAGALVGAMTAPLALRPGYPGLAIIACMIGSGAATALLAAGRTLPAIAATWAVVGALTMIFTVSFHTLRHHLTPDHLVGRVVALTRLVGFCALPVAPLVGGAILAATHAFWPVLLLSATVQTGVGVAACFTPLRTARIATFGSPEPGE